MIHHHLRDWSITTYVVSKHNLHPPPGKKTNLISITTQQKTKNSGHQSWMARETKLQHNSRTHKRSTVRTTVQDHRQIWREVMWRAQAARRTTINRVYILRRWIWVFGGGGKLCREQYVKLHGTNLKSKSFHS